MRPQTTRRDCIRIRVSVVLLGNPNKRRVEGAHTHTYFHDVAQLVQAARLWCVSFRVFAHPVDIKNQILVR